MGEKEYIEKHVFLDYVDQEIKNKYGVGYILGEPFRGNIMRIPAADVVEVRHGEWVYHECVSSYDGAKSGYSCSECNAFVDEEIFDFEGIHKDFCGHCGAKMDGGKTE